MKKSLSHTLILGLFMASAVLLSSCCNNRDSLSERTALSAVNTFLKENLQYELYHPVKIGYYEASSSNERYELRQLAANGLIDYACDVIIDENDHQYYFVDVKLTSKGKKQSQKEMPEYIAGKDMIQPTINKDEFPESKVEERDINEMSKEEKASYLEAKKLKEQREKEARKQDSLAQSQKEALAKLDKKSIQHSAKARPAAQARSTVEVVYLNCYTKKAVKAKDIVLSKDKGISTARCKVVFEVKSSEPGGRIFYKQYKGTRVTEEVSLIYYEDRGWSVNAESVKNLLAIDAVALYSEAARFINTAMEAIQSLSSALEDEESDDETADPEDMKDLEMDEEDLTEEVVAEYE